MDESCNVVIEVGNGLFGRKLHYDEENGDKKETLRKMSRKVILFQTKGTVGRLSIYWKLRACHL